MFAPYIKKIVHLICTRTPAQHQMFMHTNKHAWENKHAGNSFAEMVTGYPCVIALDLSLYKA